MNRRPLVCTDFSPVTQLQNINHLRKTTPGPAGLAGVVEWHQIMNPIQQTTLVASAPCP
ncbi:hypothetical protein PLICRDRAFT_617324 [Plicaturopsis crispa FD-325 SS-3]|uniref:Uncharacterized protein n=1 Tax=Plicaturopsis crispa FD-325 SS-3 TaxID=944288 RepID=A0A0C9T604_PLICR|nr:hypothetical protein PLICRDRAFT_449555 [Plicaturopsis crispa FD-325 SS-3]KII88249.1 hypothetical protein PLICRDRAFT_617324 [Plicaturopsis crispa FD-325 SS-3]